LVVIPSTRGSAAKVGGILEYVCEACGYHSDRLILGPAPYPDKYDPVLVSCAECKQLHSVHKPKVNDGCPKCGSELRVENQDGKVKCPSCGKRLRREVAALWD
jgi:predicted RNA-binding Zn-ribbon protein involved in translation (DUF1610 family)